MLFSEKYPNMLKSAEDKLRKSAEENGLDFEEIRRDADAGLSYELEYYGIVSFGAHYLLKRTPFEPALIDYCGLSAAYGEKRGMSGDIDVLVLVLRDGRKLDVQLRDKADEAYVLRVLRAANPGILTGDSAKSAAPAAKPQAPAVPDPEPKLPAKRISAISRKFDRILALAKELSGMDRLWYYEAGAPLDQAEITAWCKENAAHLPEAYVTLLSRANGFCVDYASKSGYFSILAFQTSETANGLYSRTADDLRAREYKGYQHCRAGFGWLHGQMLYYNPYTGEMFLETERSHYQKIADFETEILDRVIQYLEVKVTRFARKDALLETNRNNPFRADYDQLLAYRGDDAALNSGIVLYEPLTGSEIADWEHAHSIRLPEDYKNWLLLSDGGRFANITIYGLEMLEPDDTINDPDSDAAYIILASLSGSSDCLVFDPETGELFVFTDDGEIGEGDFAYDIFEEGFAYLEEES